MNGIHLWIALLKLNLKLTCHCTGAAMSPAGATVLRDVLVTSCTGIVDAIYVPPVPGLRQLSQVQKFMRTKCGSVRHFSSVILQAQQVLKAAHRFEIHIHQGKVTMVRQRLPGKCTVFIIRRWGSCQVCKFQPSLKLIPATERQALIKSDIRKKKLHNAISDQGSRQTWN